MELPETLEMKGCEQEITKPSALLHILCEVPSGRCACFFAEVKDGAGNVLFSNWLEANVPGEISLPCGEYSLRVRNASELIPHGVTKWFTLLPNRKTAVHLRFVPSFQLPIVRVKFIAMDANYPGIYPINGGISIWQQKN